MPESIDIVIEKDGSVRIEPSGHRGKTCLAELNRVLADLERAGISTTIATQKMKREYYAHAERTRAVATRK